MFPVLISYIFLKTSNASSGLFIANKNFGVSGMNENTTVLKAFTIEIVMINILQGTKLMKYKSMLQFMGIRIIPIIEDKMKIIGINIETNDAALGAVTLVWNSLT